MTTLSASQGTVNEVRSWPREFLPDDKARGQRPQIGRRHRCQLPGREDFPYSFKGTASPHPQLAAQRFLAPPRDAMPRVAEGVAG